MPEPTPTPPPGGYRIARLLVENIKRVRFVDITPDGNLVVIAGANGQGKTSILDSIMWALAGGRSFADTERPIRDGAKKGRIDIELEHTLTAGRFTITRTFTPKGTQLVVSDENGPVREQQAVLSSLIGQHSFDPFGFMRLSGRDQLATLLRVVPIDENLDQLAADRERHYNERTAVGRVRDSLHAQLSAMPEPLPGIPETETSIETILEELHAARAVVDAHAAQRRMLVDREGEVETFDAKIAECRDRADDIEEQIAKLRHEQEDLLALATGLEAQRVAAADRLEAERAEVEKLVDPDLTGIEQRLGSIDATNRQVRAARDRAAVERNFIEARDAYADHTRQIEDIDERKRSAVARAPMPIPGLTFDDDGLYFTPPDGDRPVPIQQCSDSEQLRISVAIAMALNPTLRMARIKEGSLLDKASLLLLRELAETHNFMLWVEMVADAKGDDDWLMVSDGAIVEQTTEA